MSTVKTAHTWLEIQLSSMEKHLEALVKVNSHTENQDGGNEVGYLLQELFHLPNLKCHKIESKKYAHHWVFQTAGNGSAPVSMLGHLDTVFPKGTFEGYTVDGPLRRGPGVLDMKGGLVVMAYALKALEEAKLLSVVAPINVVVVSDEEVGSPEGASVIRAHIQGSRAALVFESGRQGDAIITRRKGTGAIKVCAHGKAAHAGNAHAEGKNAIWSLARLIDAVQGLTDYASGITVNVGKISGGQSKNTVPDFAEAQMDIRFLSQAQGEALVSRCQQLCETAAVEGTRLEMSGGVSRLPLEKTEQSAALMQAYADMAQQVGLGFSEAPLVGGGSDASTSSAMGIPSIDGLGPRGKGFHTKDEFIEVQSLIPKAQALAMLLSTLR